MLEASGDRHQEDILHLRRLQQPQRQARNVAQPDDGLPTLGAPGERRVTCGVVPAEGEVSGMDFFTVNTVNTGTLTRETLEQGWENLKKMDERMARERDERGRILRELVAERGFGGPLQQRVDSLYLRGGPLIMSQRMCDGLNAALEHERSTMADTTQKEQAP